MSGRKALLAVIAAIAGAALFGAVFARTSDARWWDVELGREEAIARAAVVAQSFGHDVTSWAVDAGINRDEALNDLYARDPAQGKWHRVPEITVVFSNPQHPDSRVGVRLDRSGRPTAFVVREETPAPRTTEAAAARLIAERTLQGFVPDSRSYERIAQENLGAAGVRFAWRMPDGEVMRHASVTVSGTAVREIRVDHEAVAEPGRLSDAAQAVDIASAIVGVVATLLGIILYIVGSVRRAIPRRLVVALFAVAFVTLLADELVELHPQSAALFDPQPGGNTRAAAVVGAFLIAAATAMAASGGFPWIRRTFARQSVSFEELFVRGRLSRTVGTSLLIGAAAGGFLAAIPHVVRATGLFGDYAVNSGVAKVIFAPLLVPPRSLGLVAGLLSFSMIVPVIESKLPRVAARVLSLVAVFLLMVDPTEHLLPSLLAGVLTTLLLDQLFRSRDLLAVVAALWTSSWAIAVATRLVQADETVRAAGTTSAAVAAAGVIGALLIARFGSTRAFIPWQPPLARAERERLQAEFEVARLAQERMLPASPPQLPGLSIAAVCTPARQVGGDLYDFIELGEGRVGVAVADVSGKGVPAALVMTATKGLLLASCDGRSDPVEMLADVNTGIHSVASRNVFVTMLLGLLDANARTFEFVRAGHTPVVWRKASGEVQALSPRGIGLGMTSRGFASLLERATIRAADGELLVLYSDGVTEAMNEEREEFGEARLIDTVRGLSPELTADKARDEIVAAVRRFCGRAPAHDDLTLVVVKF